MDSLRGEIWKLICNVNKFKSQYSSEVYNKFLKNTDQKIELKISKDIFRTWPGRKDFKESALSGKNKLYNVLKAYASYDPEVGYC
jgi:hypothetical protein